MRRAQVYLDGPLMDYPFEAWVEEETWNGWAVPYFEFAEARRFTELYARKQRGCRGWHDAARLQ